MNGRRIDYGLKRSSRRTLGFSVSQSGLVVTAPKRLPHRDIENGLMAKAGWILRKLEDWEARPRPRRLDFKTGETLPWRGRDIPLVLIERGVRTRVRWADGAIEVSHDPALNGELRQRTLTAALIRFYKREGLALMSPKVEAYAERLGARLRKVSVREQRSRWGSCSPDGSIRLSWRLAGLPDDLIDYVCAHEAAHLIELNHSAAFWNLVDGLVGDSKVVRKRMRAEANQWTIMT